MNKRVLLLVNRHARRGSDDLSEAISQLDAAGLELIEESTKEPDQLPDIVRRYQDQVDLVVVGGGDGTLNAVVDGLIDTQLPLGILPMGTANDLARTLGIPEDLSKACQIITSGQTRKIDLGWVNGKHFFNVASLGLSVQIAQRLNKDAKRRWGVLAYGATALQVIRRSRPFKVEIRCNNETIHIKTVQIAVGNGRYYGGGLQVAEDAEIDDQRLDLYSLEIQHWWQVVMLLPALRSGNYATSPNVRTLQGQEIEVLTDKPRSINTDGELTTHTPAKFKLIPQALPVFVP